MKGKNIYFISGGGTGGHIYPAVTIVDKLLTDDETKKIFYIGNPKNLEFEITKGFNDITFLPVNITGMPRKLSLGFIIWLFKLFCALTVCIYYILKYKPSAIFTTGGYVSAPVVISAMILNKPYMIHDCDSVPGLVSKLAAPKAKIVSVAFENSRKFLISKNIIFNGNPIREVFFNTDKTTAREKLNIDEGKKVIFAMGGSQGAKTINNAMLEILENLSSNNENYIIVQTGNKNYDEFISKLNEIYPEHKDKKNILIKPYFNDMVYPLKAADLVISRAGSLSLSEIIQCHCASILIPYPFAAQNHQKKNAQELCEKGCSICMEDKDCTGANLLNNINNIIHNESVLRDMTEKAINISKDNSSEKIVNQLKSIIK